MLSLKFIRENTDLVQDSLIKKQSDIDINQLLDLDIKHRRYLQEVEKLRAEKNSASNTISNLIKTNQDTTSKVQSMKSVSEKINKINNVLQDIENTIRNQINYIPNLVHNSVPQGKDETAI